MHDASRDNIMCGLVGMKCRMHGRYTTWLSGASYQVLVSIYQVLLEPCCFLCTGNNTLFAHQEHNHDGFPDFPVQRYSYFSRYFLFSTPGGIFFSRGLSRIPHHLYWYIQYKVYYTVRIGIFNCTHTWHI